LARSSRGSLYAASVGHGQMLGTDSEGRKVRQCVSRDTRIAETLRQQSFEARRSQHPVPRTLAVRIRPPLLRQGVIRHFQEATNRSRIPRVLRKIHARNAATTSSSAGLASGTGTMEKWTKPVPID